MSFAQSRNQRIGRLESCKTEASSLYGTTASGQFRVTVYNPSVIRVTATQHDSFEDFSYAVVTEPTEEKISWQEDAQQVIIQTSSCQLVIDKNPVKFSFKTSDGKIICEDDLGISWIGDQVACYKKLQKGERFIGLGEKTGSLDRKGSAYQNWNTDAFAYHSGADPLYSSIPFYIGIHNGLCYGIFFDNTHKTFFNFGASNNRFASFAADAGEMNYYFIYANSVGEIIKQFTSLTGRMEMPPLWGLGYQQCRYSYYPDKEVLSIARTFREKEIPADAMVLDIHYMDQYKIFTWDKKRFADPKKTVADLKSMGFQTVVICDPGIKIENGYAAYDDGIKHDVFLKYPDGENYSGQVWPGWCHFPDFSNPNTRDWWAEKFKGYADVGVEGFWNDMNEIATWGQALPENIEFDFEGHKATTRRGRNIYGLLMARSTYEGGKKSLNGKRPFSLTRSGYAGIQRYAAMWTGDNVAHDEHMMLGVRLVNSLGLSGVAFAGYDAGGFVGDANSKLYARWISIAALSPFFRTHSMINSRDSEPWSYGEEVEMISRNYILLRYQLLPYIYSVFNEASETGLPIQRSLAIDYTHIPQVFDGTYQHQYLFGPSILVAPIESYKDIARIFLPEGEWYYLYSGKVFSGNQEIMIESPAHKLPVFIKAGAVVPAQNPVMSTSEKTNELILHVYNGQSESIFNYYVDDGETYQYQNGAFIKRRIEYSNGKLAIGKTEGTLKSTLEKLSLVFHGFTKEKFSLNGKAVTVEQGKHSFFLPLEKFDPFFEPDSMGEENVQILKLNYSPDTIEITW